MPEIVGIRFKSCGKIYDFDANGLTLKKGDKIVIDSEFGLSFGIVADIPRDSEGSQKDLKKVLRLASEEDFRQKTSNEIFEQEAKSFCYERIAARNLPMKLVKSEATLDRKRMVFYFTADGRIDFRELVKDLAARFKTRIEMRQIGVRDKARLVGGFGLCGQELCCKAFLTTFEPISIKMAKQQDLTLNAGKLSGACGRLMCCLGYEYSEGPKGGPAHEKIKEKIQESVSAPLDTVIPENEEDDSVQEDSGGPETTASGQAVDLNQKQPATQKRRRRRRNKKKPPKSE